MSAIRSGENRTETALRCALHALGLRYRKYVKDLPGNPDIVFSKSRVVVFVDGDYWHARELVDGSGSALRRRLRRLPEASRKYWLTKFRRRVQRDRDVTQLLREDGWTVVRMWESDVRRNFSRAVRLIVSEIERARSKVR
jgi:DNA mismatch endonuclease (patch repair protein)